MNALVIAKRVIKQIHNDKRSLGLMFVAPLLIMFILHTVFFSATKRPVIEVVNGSQQFIAALESQPIILHQVDNEEIARKNVLSGKTDAYVIFTDDSCVLWVEGTNPTITKLVAKNFQKAMLQTMLFSVGIGELRKNIAAKAPKVIMKTMATAMFSGRPPLQFIYGSDNFTIFDSFAPVLMGFFIFFFVFIISGISFVRERISGTLDRILATPLKRGEIVGGYFLSFGLFVSIQTILLQLFVVHVLEVKLVGSFWLLLFVNLLIATVSLSLGLFLSAFARNEFQLFQFIPVVVIPQILFSGLFDLREAALWVQVLSAIFPLTYAAEALRDVMIRGLGITAIYREVLILSGYAVGFLLLNSWALKRYRRV